LYPYHTELKKELEYTIGKNVLMTKLRRRELILGAELFKG